MEKNYSSTREKYTMVLPVAFKTKIIVKILHHLSINLCNITCNFNVADDIVEMVWTIESKSQ